MTLDPHASSERRWLRLVLNNNPLYLISAWLVLHGIGQAFAGRVGLENGSLMTQLLCGYTFALALAGWTVVRFAQAWDDARTVLLVLLLMFTGISVSYDEICLKNPTIGAWNLAFGYAFCCAVTEVILLSLRIKLPARYRVPFYIQLAVLFAAPAWLGKLSFEGRDPEMCQGVVLFPAAAALSLLLLLPAAALSPQRRINFGTPWPWPLYPWSIFVFVGAAFAIRAWMLSVSFSPAFYEDPAFQLYFLCPILLAGLLLLLEIGLRTRSTTAQYAATLSLLAVIAISFPGWRLSFAQLKIVSQLESWIASPPLIVTVAALFIATYAMIRRAAGSEPVAFAILLLAASLDAGTRHVSSLHLPHVEVLIFVAVYQAGLGLLTRSTLRLAGTGIAASVLAWLVLGDDWFAGNGLYWMAHGTIGWCATLPLFCRDRPAKWLRDTGAEWMALLAAIELFCVLATDLSAGAWAGALFVTWLALVGSLHWAWHKSPQYLLATAAAATVATVLWTIGFLDLLAEPQIRHGMAWYLLGCGALAVALLVSLARAGIVGRFWRRVERLATEENG